MALEVILVKPFTLHSPIKRQGGGRAQGPCLDTSAEKVLHLQAYPAQGFQKPHLTSSRTHHPAQLCPTPQGVSLFSGPHATPLKNIGPLTCVPTPTSSIRQG